MAQLPHTNIYGVRILVNDTELKGVNKMFSCPRCSLEMTRRTRGSNEGNDFYECPDWPRCIGTRTLGGIDVSGLTSQVVYGKVANCCQCTVPMPTPFDIGDAVAAVSVPDLIQVPGERILGPWSVICDNCLSQIGDIKFVRHRHQAQPKPRAKKVDPAEIAFKILLPNPKIKKESLKAPRSRIFEMQFQYGDTVDVVSLNINEKGEFSNFNLPDTYHPKHCKKCGHSLGCMCPRKSDDEEKKRRQCRHWRIYKMTLHMQDEMGIDHRPNTFYCPDCEQAIRVGTMSIVKKRSQDEGSC